VMEHLEGRTLADRIDRDGPIAPADAIAIALQICQGLTAAHAQGVVHRDLKPDNVFLVDPRAGSDAPLVKLLDFGIARAGPRRITAMGTVLGTPEYMAPEQALGHDIDHRVDLYALGIIVFEMLTARVPFHHAELAQVIEMHVHEPPPHLVARRSELAKLGRVDDVVQSLLAKSREARPSSAEAVVTALIAAIGSDLGGDTAERLQRATIAIGSGLIAEPGDAVPAAIRSEPTSWRGNPSTGERGAAPDPLLLSGPVPTVGRPGAAPRQSPSPARPVLIATIAAVFAGSVTFGAAQWLRDRDADPATRSPTGSARPGGPPLPNSPVPSTSEASPRPPTVVPRSPEVTPITTEPPSTAPTVTSPSSPASSATPSLAKPQPQVERSSTRHDKPATPRRPKTDVPVADTPREPPAAPPPTSPPSAADSTPPVPDAPNDPDPKPSRRPGDLKDPFPAN